MYCIIRVDICKCNCLCGYGQAAESNNRPPSPQKHNVQLRGRKGDEAADAAHVAEVDAGKQEAEGYEGELPRHEPEHGREEGHGDAGPESEPVCYFGLGFVRRGG